MKVSQKRTKETKGVPFPGWRQRRASRAVYSTGEMVMEEPWSELLSLSPSNGRERGEGSVLITLRVRNMQNEFFGREVRFP
jgi:hypothetical protein